MILAGKTAVVTGGGSGIGAAVARALAREGAAVLVCGRRIAPLQWVRDEIVREGGTAIALAADLTQEADLNRVVRETDRQWGRLDVLVNNAGILGVRAPIAEYPLKVWDDVLDVNLRTVFRVTKALLPLMTRGGSIINVSSGVGRAGRAGWGAYAVSKFGVEGLSQVLADELRERGIRVNTLNPGGTRTAMRATAYPDEDPTTLPTADAIAPVFVFLASEEAKGVTGRAIDAREWLVGGREGLLKRHRRPAL
ncbi:MAG: SDR family NAD(P)-dependent oxidoreductase [Nitrospirae bacterium]|nr:SDR family NAD(P)-dependent oxidoreductase [Nitrospirota bacterium]